MVSHKGSILGPLLFLIYINDLYRSCNIIKFILFADDTTLLASNKDMHELPHTVNKELKVISEWLTANKLSINISKTNYIIFREKSTKCFNINPVLINNVTINQVSSTRFLGVEINSEFNWKDHIKIVSKKVAIAIGLISIVKFKLSNKTLMLLYDTLVLAQLSYCNMIWASTYKTTLDKLYILRKKL